MAEFGYAHRNARFQDQLITTADGVTTVYQLLQRGRAKFGPTPCVGWRNKGQGPFIWLTYEETAKLVEDCAAGLRAVGTPVKGFIGFYAINSAEVAIFDQAASLQSMVTVGLYDTLGDNAAGYIIDHASIHTILCRASHTPHLLAVSAACPSLKVIVQIEPLTAEQESDAYRRACADKGVRVLAWHKLLELGRAHPAPHHPPAPSDLYTLLYTSGTTGTPKGVMLTHANVIAMVAAIDASDFPRVPGERHLSFLPMAHVYERIVQLGGLFTGGASGFYSGEVTKLLEDMAILKPTIMVGVPRLYQKIHDAVMAQVSQSVWHRRKLFEYAFNAKKEAIERGEPTPMISNLVFGKVRARLGGCIRLLVSGSAPLSPELANWLRIVFDCPVVQGYGLSETSACGASQSALEFSTGNVGTPSGAIEIKLASVPEMNYSIHDQPYPRGEVLMRGPPVFAGYYKDEAQTREAFTDDGWFRTGDVGQWLPGGKLEIIDRKKNIFKLSQGEYVAAERLENILTSSAFVQSIWVYGDSTKDSLVAVVRPDPDTLLPWAKQHLPHEPATLDHLCTLPAVRALVLDDLTRIGKAGNLKGFELVKAVYLTPEEWTPQTGIVTPTMKLKRPAAKQRFQAAIDEMYRNLAPSSGKPLVARL